MLLVKFEYKINDIVRLGRPTSQLFLPGPTAHCSWASTGLNFVSKAFIDKRQSLNSLIRVSSGPRRWACSELHVDYCRASIHNAIMHEQDLLFITKVDLCTIQICPKCVILMPGSERLEAPAWLRLNGTVRSIAIVLTLAIDEAQLWSLAIVTEVPGTMDRETRNKEWGWVFTLQERKYFPFRPQDRYPQNVEPTLVPRSRWLRA